MTPPLPIFVAVSNRIYADGVSPCVQVDYGE